MTRASYKVGMRSPHFASRSTKARKRRNFTAVEKRSKEEKGKKEKERSGMREENRSHYLSLHGAGRLPP